MKYTEQTSRSYNSRFRALPAPSALTCSPRPFVHPSHLTQPLALSLCRLPLLSLHAPPPSHTHTASSFVAPSLPRYFPNPSLTSDPLAHVPRQALSHRLVLPHPLFLSSPIFPATIPPYLNHSLHPPPSCPAPSSLTPLISLLHPLPPLPLYPVFTFIPLSLFSFFFHTLLPGMRLLFRSFPRSLVVGGQPPQ